MDRRRRGMRTDYMSDATEKCMRDVFWLPRRADHATVVGFPSAKDPRFLVATDDRRAAVRMVHRQFGGGNALRRVGSFGLLTLIISGLAERIPKFRLDLGDTPVEMGYLDWLNENLPVGTRAGAVLLGPPRANRKPVVLLTDRRGDLVGVAKFGVNSVTSPLVRHEAKALGEVGAALGEIMHLPRLVAAGQVGKSEVLLMAPLPASATGQRPSRRALVETVLAIAEINRRPGAPLWDIASHPRLAPLRSRVEDVMENVRGVPIGSFHGDLHPGNLAVACDGRVMLWDWERWGYGAPLGFDLLHHDLHNWISVEGMAPSDAASAIVAEAPTILSPLGVDPLAATAVGRDYLIRLGARYAADRQDRAGSGLGAIEDWLFPAVLR